MTLIVKDVYLENKCLKYKDMSAVAFYDKYAAMLYGHIYRLVESEKLATQIQMEVFTEVFRMPHKFVSPHLTSFCVLVNHSSIKTERLLKVMDMFANCKVC